MNSKKKFNRIKHIAESDEDSDYVPGEQPEKQKGAKPKSTQAKKTKKLGSPPETGSESSGSGAEDTVEERKATEKRQEPKEFWVSPPFGMFGSC